MRGTSGLVLDDPRARCDTAPGGVREGPGRTQTGREPPFRSRALGCFRQGCFQTTGARRDEICRGNASPQSLDSRAQTPPYPRRAPPPCDHWLRPEAMKRFITRRCQACHFSKGISTVGAARAAHSASVGRRFSAHAQCAEACDQLNARLSELLGFAAQIKCVIASGRSR
jgi:hypothetical protein